MRKLNVALNLHNGTSSRGCLQRCIEGTIVSIKRSSKRPVTAGVGLDLTNFSSDQIFLWCAIWITPYMKEVTLALFRMNIRWRNNRRVWPWRYKVRVYIFHHLPYSYKFSRVLIFAHSGSAKFENSRADLFSHTLNLDNFLARIYFRALLPKEYRKPS